MSLRGDGPLVGRSEIEAAWGRIEGRVRVTPMLDLGAVIADSWSLVLKLEHLQATGSFKTRGAMSALTAAHVPPAGVVAASGGNFGLAVAHAATSLGHRATIFVPETSPGEKIDLIGGYGAEVRVVPGYYDEALAASREFAGGSGAMELHAYDQTSVVAGQGTLGREIDLQDEADVILTAVGGGGLIAGLAGWFQGSVKVVAVEPELCPGFNRSLAAGEPVETEVGGVASSSLGSRSIGEHAWRARALVAGSVLVSETAIVEAQRWLWSKTRLAVEPAAATTVAALLEGVYEPAAGERVVAVLSGGNVDPGSVA